MVYLKSRKFSLFLQTQLDFALNSLEIHKGFLRLFALNPACACEIFVIFFVFRYTLGLRLIGKYGEHNGKTNRRRGTLPPGGQPPQPHRTGVQPARHRLPGHRAGRAGAVQGAERGELLVSDERFELRAGAGDPCAGAAADGAFGAGCARPVDGAPHPGGKGRWPCLVDAAQR